MNFDKILIWSPDHLHNHAAGMAQTLRDEGIDAKHILEYSLDDRALYVIFCPFMWTDEFPKNYVIYNVEFANRFLLGPERIKQFDQALQIWHYSRSIMEYFHSLHGSSYMEKSNIVPAGPVFPWLYTNLLPHQEREIDVLFYGTLSGRRKETIDFLRRHNINVTVIKSFENPFYGSDMLNELLKAKIVLNVHHSENRNHFETFRVNEALCCGCHVLSETSLLLGMWDIYHSQVLFYESHLGLLNMVRYILNGNYKKTFDPYWLTNSLSLLNCLKKL